VPGEVAAKLASIWQQQVGEAWLIAKASGRIQESRNSAYDLEIVGVIQACTGPDTPELNTVCSDDAARRIADDADDLLVFGGRYEHEPIEDFQETLGDWSIWRLAAAARPNAAQRWQWWRFWRGVWLPSPFLARTGFEFRCTQEAVVVEEDGCEVARWTDWTHNLQEMTAGNRTPSSGQMLLIRRSLVERAAARVGGTFAWICRIKTSARKHDYGSFTGTDFVVDFGTTRIVRSGAES
jgi:hypothetical protein